MHYNPRHHGHMPPSKTNSTPARVSETHKEMAGRCRFLEIAPELRLEIYEALFSSSDGVRLSLGGDIIRRCKGNERRAAILSTCKTVFYEGRLLFFDHMNFRINVITTHAFRTLQNSSHAPKLNNMIYWPILRSIRNLTVDFHLVHEARDAVATIHEMAGPLVHQINQLSLKTLQINLTISVGVHQHCFDAFTGICRHLRCRGVVTLGKLDFGGGGYKDFGGFRRARYPETTSWTEMLSAIGGRDASDPTPFEAARKKLRALHGLSEDDEVLEF